MAGPSLTGGNPDNYRIGKGVLSFTPVGGTKRDLGNATEITLTPEIETLEHFSSRAGLRQKDKEVVLETGGTVAATLEEFTAFNVALMTMGTLDEAAVGGPEVDIFQQAEIRGRLEVVATNVVGPRWDWDLYNVSITPTGEFSAIDDEWGNMELEMSVLASTEAPNVGKFGILKQTNLEEAS